VVAPYARRTLRLHELLTLIGFVSGGEAGRKLVEGMKLSTSPDTLLRLIRATPDQPFPTPRILGVDDFGATRSYRCSCKTPERRILPGILLPVPCQAESSAPGTM
jgi:hypothetical protein